MSKLVELVNRKEFQDILNAINTAIFIDDHNGDTLWINKACEDLYKIDKRDIIGRNIRDLETDGIFSPSVAKQTFINKAEVSIVHSNRNGKKLLTTGIPLEENQEIHGIVTTSRDITELVCLKNKLDNMQDELDALRSNHLLNGMVIYRSKEMQETLLLAKRLSKVESTVLITGESGVGKGVISKFIHENGPRSNFEFVKVNCGAIPDTLLESELFGYDEGAFTGSKKRGKLGLFEIANGGTIFLDEIGEMPLHLQVKILQVLQDREIKRVGGTKSIPISVRVIAATNKNLEEMVKQGTFREDLYYRLSVVPMHIKPLRERKDDILAFTHNFLEKFNKKFEEVKHFSQGAIERFINYNWPGNVRELENMIERLVITTDTEMIDVNHLPKYICNQNEVVEIIEGATLEEMLSFYEKNIIVNAAKQSSNTRELAKSLGISQATIVRKMKKHKIKPLNC